MKHVVPSSLEHGSELGAASSCIAGVLRRVLCRSFRGRVRRNGDGVYEFDVEKEKGRQRKCEEATSASPGIVARLLGIDCRPACPCAPPSTMPRSRSANSVEPWQRTGILGEESSYHGHRQFRKSKSFREAPTYLRKESDDFLVLSFGTYNDECDALDLKAAKACLFLEQYELRKNSGERKMVMKRRSYGYKSFQIDPEPKKCNPRDSKVAETCSSRTKKKTFAARVMEFECNSESSSPVSVFDIAIDAEGECLTSPDSSTLVPDAMREEEKGSRKAVSPTTELSNTEHALAKSGERGVLCRSNKDRRKKARKCQVTVDGDVSDIWAYICKLTEENLNRASWVARKLVKDEQAEEIGCVIGQEILEFLFQEAVVEMSYCLTET